MPFDDAAYAQRRYRTVLSNPNASSTTISKEQRNLLSNGLDNSVANEAEMTRLRQKINNTVPLSTDTTSYVKIVEAGDSKASVKFKVAPEISEEKSVNYIEISEIRAPGSLMIFISSPGRTFSVNAKLVSRTSAEADQNFKDLNLMKSWGMPNKGTRNISAATRETLDEDAPKVLYLYGYGANFKGIQMVLKNISSPFPSDCDYIWTSDGKAKMPIIMPITLSFQEIRSANELTGDGDGGFDIQKYKTGTLDYW